MKKKRWEAKLPKNRKSVIGSIIRKANSKVGNSKKAKSLKKKLLEQLDDTEEEDEEDEEHALDSEDDDEDDENDFLSSILV